MRGSPDGLIAHPGPELTCQRPSARLKRPAEAGMPLAFPVVSKEVLSTTDPCGPLPFGLGIIGVSFGDSGVVARPRYWQLLWLAGAGENLTLTLKVLRMSWQRLANELPLSLTAVIGRPYLETH